MSTPKGTSIETHPSGKYFDFVKPSVFDIEIEDIACALSNTCRFGGHVSRFYSVAEHAVRVSWWVRDHGLGPMTQLAALHHDSHEAYLGDIPTPLKKRIGPLYERLAQEVDALIGDVALVNPVLFRSKAVKAADAYMLRVEAGQLKKSGGVGEQWGNVSPLHSDDRLGWSSTHARDMFLGLHLELSS